MKYFYGFLWFLNSLIISGLFYLAISQTLFSYENSMTDTRGAYQSEIDTCYQALAAAEGERAVSEFLKEEYRQELNLLLKEKYGE